MAKKTMEKNDEKKTDDGNKQESKSKYKEFYWIIGVMAGLILLLLALFPYQLHH